MEAIIMQSIQDFANTASEEKQHQNVCRSQQGKPPPWHQTQMTAYASQKEG